MSDSYIPFEIQEEIMKKLPLTSLIRFRSVSKAWKSLISFKFIAKLDNVSQPPHQFKVTTIWMILIIIIIHSMMKLSPNSTLLPTQPSDRGYETVVGFGVCHFTLDPKIIMIPHCFKKDIGFRISRVDDIKEVIDGFIYWLASDNFKIGCDIVISFDLTSEEFREIHLPESIKLNFLSISKLRETLVVLEYNMVIFSEIKFHAVWMMDNDSFTRLYTIKEPATSLDRILGFRKTGAIIIVRLVDNDDNQVLATYEPDSKPES
ncbi:putative F-box domain-containing protein [Tanacetum coccineum]|uniref:F-box domain-containing protein n=1 Tax=Tanacetum coccineum TaxID=301880 RepID=A0ABQ5HSX0_9ASTR